MASPSFPPQGGKGTRGRERASEALIEPLEYAEKGFREVRGTDSRSSTRMSATARLCCVGLTVVLLLLAAAPRQCTADPPDGTTAEALVARGVRLFKGHQMRRGLTDLEAAVALDPDLAEARAALAAALLRSGEFERAALGFEHAVGEELTSRLAAGSAGASEVHPDVDREAIYGLAICRAQLGLDREADRLYRIYADLVGVTEPAAAKAYYRLAELFRTSGVSWGDAEAEMAKAYAIDPAIETKSLLVGFPDLASLPRFAPYTWPIELSSDPPDSMSKFDRLPILLRWIEPDLPTDAHPLTPTEATVVDLLVDRTGRVSDVRIIESPGSDCSIDVSMTVAAMQWLFEPAVIEDAPAPAWIRLSVIHHPSTPASTESP